VAGVEQHSSVDHLKHTCWWVMGTEDAGPADEHEHEVGCMEGDEEDCTLFDDYKFDEEDEERISELFQKLDVNEDGRIDIGELSQGLHRLKIHHVPDQAEHIMKRGDITDDNHLSFDEFLKFCHEHEKKLWLVFKSIDRDNSGTLTRAEIKQVFEEKLGVPMTDTEVDYMLRKLDRNGNLKIDWHEWRDFHQLHPHAHDINAIAKFWRHAHIDIGEDMNIPEDLYEEEKLKGRWWKQLMSGAVAGVISRSCTAPLDRLKILLQVHAGSTKNNWSLQRGFQKMLSEGGFTSLWRGNMVNCLKIGPESAIKFYAYEWMKRNITGESGNVQIGIRERFVAGSFAGICSQTSIYPMEVLKTRLALGKTGEYANLKDCAVKVYKKDGVRVFFKGLVPGVIGVIPYAGIDLCVYETLKLSWLRRHSDTSSSDPGVMVLLLCGAVSSSCGQLASYPFALVRTKLQAQTNDPTFTGIRATGMRDMFVQIVQQNGLLGLYRGILPNFLKVLPAVSISYAVYEKTRKFLGMT